MTLFHAADEPFVEGEDVDSQCLDLSTVEVDHAFDGAGYAVDENVHSDEVWVAEH